jgi:hypothetical protein
MRPKAPVRSGHKTPAATAPSKVESAPGQPPAASPSAQQGWQRVWKWADTGSSPMGEPRLGLARLVQ